MVVGSFGSDVVFEVSYKKVMTPRSAQREVSASYAKHAVLGAKERLEFLHANIIKFSLDVFLSSAFGVNPQDVSNILQTKIESGQYERLILGGVNHGSFVISKMSESWSKTDPSGRPVSMALRLDFEEYIE